jgi:peptide-methionine (R)-S-oxide reductase|tara:strand:- start:40 stop:444 length:405 start_codon:yes stop_codon:yes gene_type:complete
MNKPEKYPIVKSESEWHNELSDEEFRVLRKKGTELPFTGKYNNHFDKGVYRCRACDTPLYDSESKFESGCGWPSYDKALPGALEFIKDNSHGMIRTEIVCAKCGGHQGHVFNDGPSSTGERYCVNSVSIRFDSE